MALKHVVLRNPRLKGWEYGMLRAFEEEIVRNTGAEIIEVPEYGKPVISKRVAHSTRWDAARAFLPKKSFAVDADVIWYILMGPENDELDLFSDWDKKAKYRITYIFDTLEPQFQLIKKLYSSDRFNVRITSFNDAVSFLEELTGKPWHVIEQAVPGTMFHQVPLEQKVIPFSSYGRRFAAFHAAMQAFCESNGLYYDYTTHNGRTPTAPELELYLQYAWHLNHSLFTISWPVELTNPARAGRLHPITCRWFEAAAAGTIILGRKPANERFDDYLSTGLVVDIDPFGNRQAIWNRLETIYADREALFQKANAIREANAYRWTWQKRVESILELIK